MYLYKSKNAYDVKLSPKEKEELNKRFQDAMEQKRQCHIAMLSENT